MVCVGCHATLGGSSLNVGETGEFCVPTPEMLDEASDMPDPEPGERPRSTDACSWCGKPESQVKKLLGRSGTALCNECVSLACDIMDAELGSTWR